MKRLYACISVLTLLICVGCSQRASPPTEQPPAPSAKVDIKIESEQTIFKVGEDVTIMITIKNLTSQNLDAPETYWSAVVLLDGKEYKRLPEHMRAWNGPGVIIPDGYMYTGFTLSEYGITKQILSIGKHDVAVKIGDATSNTLVITIQEDS